MDAVDVEQDLSFKELGISAMTVETVVHPDGAGISSFVVRVVATASDLNTAEGLGTAKTVGQATAAAVLRAVLGLQRLRQKRCVLAYKEAVEHQLQGCGMMSSKQMRDTVRKQACAGCPGCPTP